MHKIKCSLHRVLKWIFPFFIISVFSVLPSFVHAEDKAEDIIDVAKKFDEMLAKKDKEKNGDWVEKFKLASKFLQDGEKNRRKFNLAIGLGFDGNKAESEEKSLYKLDISGEITKGGYPREFRFKAVTSVLKKGGVLQEDVKKMSVNYGYHIHPWLKTYGFAENFSSTFLNIEQRYEIGFGLQFEKEFGKKREVAKGIENYRIGFESNKEFWEDMNKLKSEKSAEERKSLCKQLNDLKKGGKIVKEYLKKKNAKFGIGLAFSLFYELEHAKYKDTYTLIDEETGESKEITRTINIYAQPLIRVSLRPSVTVRPIDNLSIYGKIDWKMNPKKMTDYRREGLLGAKLDLPSLNSEWSEKMSLVFEYIHYFDKYPPVFHSGPDEIISVRKHEEFKFKLNIKL